MFTTMPINKAQQPPPGLIASITKPEQGLPVQNQPAQATTTKWQVDKPQTVSGQVQDVISQDSPLMQQARTTGLQQANSRGLLNSSMAVGAAQDAVLRQALPIAQADANTYATSGQTNAGAANRTSEFNAGAINESNQFNRELSEKGRQFDVTDVEGKRQFDVTGADQRNQFNRELSEKGRQFNATDAEGRRQFNQDFSEKLRQFDATGAEEKRQFDEFEKNKKIIDSNKGASSLYDTYMQAVNQIMNSNMDAANKQAALNLQFQTMQQGMQMYTDIEGLNLLPLSNAPDSAAINTYGDAIAPPPPPEPIEPTTPRRSSRPYD